MIKMFFQFETLTAETIIGVGLMFGLAFFMNYMTYNDLTSFFVFLCIFDAFMVWCEFLPYWTLVLLLIILVIIVYVKMMSKGGGGGEV